MDLVRTSRLENERDEQALKDKYAGSMVYREGDRSIVKIPVRFQRRNGRQMIFAVGEGATSNSKSDDKALALAIARARNWQDELESGEYATIEELPSDKKIDVSDARRIFRLNPLAPILSRRFCRTTHPIIPDFELSIAGSR